MKNIVVLGNWKSNKSRVEAKAWVEGFFPELSTLPKNLTLIICPAFHHLDLFLSSGFSEYLGVQNVSMYKAGAYTGEVAASMVAGDVRYAMVGHSERRKYFGETDEMVVEKVKQCSAANIIPIVCVSRVSEVKKLRELVVDFAKSGGMLLYEPLFAVGSGQAQSPEEANSAAKELVDVLGSVKILYGGSVTPENVAGYTKQEFLSGVGVGGASLDPQTFTKLLVHALQNTSQ